MYNYCEMFNKKTYKTVQKTLQNLQYTFDVAIVVVVVKLKNINFTISYSFGLKLTKTQVKV